jgi:phenylacetate-CoA ligase
MTLHRNLERRLKDALMGCYYVPGYDLSNAALDRCLKLMSAKRIRHLWGYPGSLYCLAARAQEVGWSTCLSSIVTWGDQLHPHYRTKMERAFGTRVLDTYGCGEGMQIAAQCGHGPHYHVHELDVVVEFLDDQGHPVADGQPGNIVLTRLHLGPMPFIRYAIGDVGRSAGNRQCDCGRVFKLLDGIQGRSADYVLTPSGNRLIVHFFTGILEYFSEVDSFQVIQDRVDALRLRIVPGPGFNQEVQQKICQTLTEKGADLKIEVELVDEIPLSAGGKRRFVVRTVEASGTSAYGSA